MRIPTEDIERLDEAIKHGHFPSRAAAVRAGIDHVLREAREREIEESYRRAYSKHPREEWIAEASAAAMGELLEQRERDDPEG